MAAPRMRVGHLGNSDAGTALAAAMAGAGHTVEPLTDLSQAGDYEALILGTNATQLPRVIAAVEPAIRRGQIVIHTVLSEGVQILDELEVKGAVVMALAPVLAERWVVTTLDELGETIAGLILGEAGIIGFPKTDAERPMVAAHVEQARMLRGLYQDAMRNVAMLMPSEDTEDVPGFPSTDGIIHAYRGIDEPGMRRAFLESARRTGELFHREDIEMWALQEETK